MNIKIRPIITEKTLGLVQTQNKYTFEVGSNVNKIQIGKWFSKHFNVNVINVQTSNSVGKMVRFGRSRAEGRQKATKRAIITLKSGDTISDFNIK